MAYLLQEFEDHSEVVKSLVVCKKRSALMSYCQQNQIEYFTLPFIYELDLYSAYKLKRISQKIKPDIIHIHSAHAHSIAVLSSLLFRNHLPLILSRRVDFEIKKNWFSKFKYNHDSIKKIICVSNAVEKVISPVIKNKKKITVVYDGIDLQKFKNSYKKEDLLKKTHNLPMKAKIVGNIAALTEQKDHRTFIEAARKISEEYDNVYFFIIGEGRLRNFLESLADSKGLRGHIIFTGFRSDIEKILTELDVLLFTSQKEGLGSIVLDAFNAGVPVVASNAGGIPEMITHQKTGLLAKIKDTEEFAQNVINILRSPELRDRLVKNAKKKVKSFSKETTASATLKVYNEALDPSIQ